MADTKTPTVLVVEDEPDMNNLLADVLSAYGFEPVQANTGRQALAALAEQTPDAILLDLMLPDLNGFELCRQLKTSRTTRKIPVLILTALDRPADRRAGFESGADDYLTKPFTPEGLVARLRASLERCGRAVETCAPIHLAIDLSASVNDLKSFNSLMTCLYCCTVLESEQIEALREGLVALSDAAGRWAADHRGASPARLEVNLDRTSLRLKFRAAAAGTEAFLAEHLEADAAVPSKFTDAGIIDRVIEEPGAVVLEKTLPPPER